MQAADAAELAARASIAQALAERRRMHAALASAEAYERQMHADQHAGTLCAARTEEDRKAEAACLERATAEEQATAAHIARENSVHLRAETGEVINLNAHRLSARRWRAAAAVSVFTLTGAVASVGVWAPTVGASAIAYARRHALPNASLKLTYELSLPPEDAFARTSGTPAAPASESTKAPGIGAS